MDARMVDIIRHCYRGLEGNTADSIYLYEILNGDNTVMNHITNEELTEMIISLEEYYLPGLMNDYRVFYGEEIDAEIKTPLFNERPSSTESENKMPSYFDLLVGATNAKHRLDIILECETLQGQAKEIWNKYKQYFGLSQN